LNLISKTDTGLMGQNAVLGKFGGLFSQLISVQAKKALGDRLLYQATKDLMKGSADLADTLGFVGNQWRFVKGETGRFLLTAMQPLIEKFGMFLNSLRLTVAVMKDNKNLLFLAKSFIMVSSAALGLAGALGTLRLAGISLGSLGFGLPRLIFLAVTLGSVFLGVTEKAQKLSDKIKVFAGFIRGVWQLVTSLDRKTGIAQIDEDLKKLLEDNGLFVFAQNVARVGSVIKRVVEDLVDAFRWLSARTDEVFGGIARKFINMVSKFKKPWENFWVSDTATTMQKFVRNFAVIGGTLGSIFTAMIAKTLAGKAMGLASKIPGLGFLGGGKGGGPSGRASDPIYTRSADVVAGGIGSMLGNAMGGLWNLIKGPLTPLIALFSKLGTVIEYTTSYGFAGLRYALMDSILPILKIAQTAFTDIIAPVMIFGSAIWGAIQGVMETASEWGKFFQGIFDLGKAVGGVVLKFIESIPLLKFMKDTLVTIAKGLYNVGKFLLIDGPMTIMKLIAEGWKQIFGWLGIGAGKLGESMSALAKNISPDSFSMVPEGPMDGTKLTKDEAMNTAGKSGEKTNISVPEDTKSPEETVDSLGEQLKGLSDAQRKSSQKAIEDAMRSDSAGGAAITAEEMEGIMKSMANQQVNLLGEIADNTRPIKNKGISGTRRD